MSLNHSAVYKSWQSAQSLKIDTLLQLEVAAEFDYNRLSWFDDTNGLLENLDWMEGYPQLQDKSTHFMCTSFKCVLTQSTDTLRISFDMYRMELLQQVNPLHRVYDMHYT